MVLKGVWVCVSVDIEELTRKTGNFKRFPIFVNMLLSAISQRSDAVFIDLLTTSDLVQCTHHVSSLFAHELWPNISL